MPMPRGRKLKACAELLPTLIAELAWTGTVLNAAIPRRPAKRIRRCAKLIDRPLGFISAHRLAAPSWAGKRREPARRGSGSPDLDRLQAEAEFVARPAVVGAAEIGGVDRAHRIGIVGAEREID